METDPDAPTDAAAAAKTPAEPTLRSRFNAKVSEIERELESMKQQRRQDEQQRRVRERTEWELEEQRRAQRLQDRKAQFKNLEILKKAVASSTMHGSSRALNSAAIASPVGAGSSASPSRYASASNLVALAGASSAAPSASDIYSSYLRSRQTSSTALAAMSHSGFRRSSRDLSSPTVVDSMQPALSTMASIDAAAPSPQRDSSPGPAADLSDLDAWRSERAARRLARSAIKEAGTSSPVQVRSEVVSAQHRSSIVEPALSTAAARVVTHPPVDEPNCIQENAPVQTGFAMDRQPCEVAVVSDTALVASTDQLQSRDERVSISPSEASSSSQRPPEQACSAQEPPEQLENLERAAESNLPVASLSAISDAEQQSGQLPLVEDSRYALESDVNQPVESALPVASSEQLDETPEPSLPFGDVNAEPSVPLAVDYDGVLRARHEDCRAGHALHDLVQQNASDDSAEPTRGTNDHSVDPLSELSEDSEVNHESEELSEDSEVNHESENDYQVEQHDEDSLFPEATRVEQEHQSDYHHQQVIEQVLEVQGDLEVGQKDEDSADLAAETLPDCDPPTIPSNRSNTDAFLDKAADIEPRGSGDDQKDTWAAATADATQGPVCVRPANLEQAGQFASNNELVDQYLTDDPPVRVVDSSPALEPEPVETPALEAEPARESSVNTMPDAETHQNVPMLSTFTAKDLKDAKAYDLPPELTEQTTFGAADLPRQTNTLTVQLLEAPDTVSSAQLGALNHTFGMDDLKSIVANSAETPAAGGSGTGARAALLGGSTAAQRKTNSIAQLREYYEYISRAEHALDAAAGAAGPPGEGPATWRASRAAVAPTLTLENLQSATGGLETAEEHGLNAENDAGATLTFNGPATLTSSFLSNEEQSYARLVTTFAQRGLLELADAAAEDAQAASYGSSASESRSIASTRRSLAPSIEARRNSLLAQVGRPAAVSTARRPGTMRRDSSLVAPSSAGPQGTATQGLDPVEDLTASPTLVSVGGALVPLSASGATADTLAHEASLTPRHAHQLSSDEATALATAQAPAESSTAGRRVSLAAQGRATMFDRVLYRVKGRRRLFVTRVPTVGDAVTQQDSFVLVVPDAPTSPGTLPSGARILVWHGAASGKVKRAKALDIATRVRDKEWNNRARLEIDPGNAFLEELDGPGVSYAPPSWDADDERFETEYGDRLTLYAVSDRNVTVRAAGGRLAVSALAPAEAAFVLDDGLAEVHVWAGRAAPGRACELALGLADGLVKQAGRPAHVQRLVQRNGAEDVVFKEKFADWGEGMALAPREAANPAVPDRTRHVYDRGADAPRAEMVDVAAMHKPPPLPPSWDRADGEMTAEKPIDDVRAVSLQMWLVQQPSNASAPPSPSPAPPESDVKRAPSRSSLGSLKAKARNLTSPSPASPEADAAFRELRDKRVLLPTSEHGQLYSGETYVMLYRYETSKEKTEAVLYYWIGADSSSGDQGVTALEVIEMGKRLEARQRRVVQGKEPAHFVHACGTAVAREADGSGPVAALVVRRGRRSVQSGANAPSRLFQVRQLHWGRWPAAVVVECPQAVVAALNSGSSFVLSTGGKERRTLVWHGAASGPEQMAVSMAFARDAARGSAVTDMREGSEAKGWWSALGCSRRAPQPGEYASGPAFSTRARLVRHCIDTVTDEALAMELLARYESRLFRIAHIVHGAPSAEELVPFAQTDLAAEGVFVLDAFCDVFVWIGPAARSDYKSLQLAVDTALAYAEYVRRLDPLERGTLDRSSHIHIVHGGFEPPLFRAQFVAWDDATAAAAAVASLPGVAAPASPARSGARKPADWLRQKLFSRSTAADPVAEALAAVAPHRQPMSAATFIDAVLQARYTVRELADAPDLPLGIDPRHVELYLVDDEFQALFQMTKAEFSALAEWRQNELKRKVGPMLRPRASFSSVS